MNKKISKFFTNDLTLHFATVISIVFVIIQALVYSVAFGFTPSTLFIYLGIGFVVFFLDWSYNRHEKNVMKGLIGALLAIVIISQFTFAFDYNLVENLKVLSQTTIGYIELALSIVNLILFVMLFINHFVINSEHHSNPRKIKFNQVVIYLIAAVSLAEIVLSIFVYPNDAVIVVEYICRALLAISLLVMIVCIESKLDAYRIIKEEKK